MNLDLTDTPDDDGQAPEVLETGSKRAQLEAPQEWRDSYADTDRQAVLQVIDWLNQAQQTQTHLARIARINPSTLNQVIAGRYPSSPTKFLSQMLDAITSETERLGMRGVPFVETSVSKLANAIFHRARTYKNIGVLSAFVGTGKTTAAREYQRRTSNVYIVECIRNMSASALLDSLCQSLNLTAEVRGASKEKKFLAIVRALARSESLIIVDEAETVTPESLHYVRRLRDLAEVGIVLVGTEHLLTLIKVEGGRFDQVRSRVGFWPRRIDRIEREDCDAVVFAAFPEMDVDVKTLDAFWAISGGSIRILVESLIPAIRDFGLRAGHKLNAPLVRHVAKEVLGIGGAS